MSKHSTEQKATIFVVFITSFITTFTGSALNLSIPSMSREFDVPASMIGWVVTSYMLTLAALSVPFGRLADITRKKRVFITGIMVFSLALLASAFVGDFTVMILCRVLTGIGGAMIVSTNTAILISAFPGGERGGVLGFSVASTYMGLSSGPVAGGLLNHYFGWRSIFIAAFAVSGTVFATALKTLPAGDKNKEKQSFDILGNILYILMIIMIMYGFTEVVNSKIAIALIAAGIIVAVCFVRYELKASNPIIQVRLFSGNISYAFSNLATLLNYGATSALSYLLSIYLQVIMKYTSQRAGLIMITQPIFMAGLSPFAGRLSDRVSPFLLSSLGMGFCAAGVTFFIFIGTDYPLWLIMLALVITGIGFALFSSPNTNAVMSCVEAKDYSVASSILATMRSMGNVTSMSLVTLVVSMYLGRSSLANAAPEILLKTIHTSFAIFLAICVIGIFISAKRKKPGGKSV